MTYQRGFVQKTRSRPRRRVREESPVREEIITSTRKRRRRARSPTIKPRSKRRKKGTKKEIIASLRAGDRLTMLWPPTNSWSTGEILCVYNGLDGVARSKDGKPQYYFKIAFNDDPADQGPLVYKLDEYKFKVIKWMS